MKNVRVHESWTLAAVVPTFLHYISKRCYASCSYVVSRLKKRPCTWRRVTDWSQSGVSRHNPSLLVADVDGFVSISKMSRWLMAARWASTPPKKGENKITVKKIKSTTGQIHVTMIHRDEECQGQSQVAGSAAAAERGEAKRSLRRNYTVSTKTAPQDN